jgi:hypothetical protein
MLQQLDHGVLVSCALAIVLMNGGVDEEGLCMVVYVAAAGPRCAGEYW